MIVEDQMICEIQLRTKLQNAWSEFTHELHSKAPTEFQTDCDTAIAEIANNLAVKDRAALAVREILQSMTERKESDDF